MSTTRIRLSDIEAFEKLSEFDKRILHMIDDHIYQQLNKHVFIKLSGETYSLPISIRVIVGDALEPMKEEITAAARKVINE